MDRTPDVEDVVAQFRSPITEIKTSSLPLVEPELSPVPCFFTGNSAAIAVLFAPWPAEVCQVDSSSLASRKFDS
jgi:hypothetical protein